LISANETAKRIIANVEKVIVGKRKQLALSLVSWFSGGHILLEDVKRIVDEIVAEIAVPTMVQASVIEE